jgi:hypothetical protein
VRAPEDTSRYYVTYRIDFHEKGLTADEVKAMPETGGTHDFLLVSMMHQQGGGLSVMNVSHSHVGGELTPIEIFKAISVMMPNLAEQLPEGSWQRFAAQSFVDFVRKVMLLGREVPRGT